MSGPVDGAELNEILNLLALTHPVELVDVAAIRTALSDIPGLEVFHRIREVIVRVRRLNYERSLLVVGAPALVGKKI